VDKSVRKVWISLWISPPLWITTNLSTLFFTSYPQAGPLFPCCLSTALTC
jgi:hypothetical protein